MTLESIEYFEKAVKLCRLKKPKLKDAFELFLSASHDGNPKAIYALATWYIFGNEVVEKNEKQAVKLLKSIVNSNIAEANFQLALAYDQGWGVKRHSGRAFSLYMRAALLGDKDACDQISQYYAEGKYVKFDENLAAAWKTRSEQCEKDISPPYRVWMDP
jgi:uncharacterized protein